LVRQDAVDPLVDDQRDAEFEELGAPHAALEGATESVFNDHPLERARDRVQRPVEIELAASAARRVDRARDERSIDVTERAIRGPMRTEVSGTKEQRIHLLLHAFDCTAFSRVVQYAFVSRRYR
jgi:hypothetical protein